MNVISIFSRKEKQRKIDNCPGNKTVRSVVESENGIFRNFNIYCVLKSQAC